MTTLRPINLSAAHVRQLPGTLMIERKISPQPGPDQPWIGFDIDSKYSRAAWEGAKITDRIFYARSPWGAPGQKFWVREGYLRYTTMMLKTHTIYRAGGAYRFSKWFPARTMPREYSRFTLQLVTVTVTQRAGVWYWRGEFEVPA